MLRTAHRLLLLVTAASASTACSTSNGAATSKSTTGTGAGGAGGATGTGGSVDHSPADWNKPVTAPPDDVARAKRAACGYAKGALPAETQGASAPMGKDIPIDTIVIMMGENRSFDHYFQGANKAGIKDIEIAPDTFSNPGAGGKSVPVFRDKTFCFLDTHHGWDAVHQQVNGGKMDGFVATNDDTQATPIPGIPLAMMSGSRAMTYYEEADLPFLYWAAKNFAIGDHYHCSVPGPTWPNRMYLYAASSFGRTTNHFPTNVDATLMDRLDVRGIPWRIYKSDTPCYAIFVDRLVAIENTDKLADLSQFYTDAAAGKLPPVVFIDAGFSINDNNKYMQESEHPPAIMEYGQRAIARVADALSKSPQWSRSAMFITYDEHGGLWDHVPPPKACPPDDRAVENGAPGQAFDMLGIRVPFVAISPFAKKRFVGHHVYDHTSITRFVEARFTLPALSNRDANAEAPWDMFDFAGVPNAAPPVVPIPSVDPATASACKALWNP